MKPRKQIIDVKFIFSLLVALCILVGFSGIDLGVAVYAAPSVPTTFTILHTSDFHGQLELSGSNPGAAKLATAINTVKAAVGAGKVVLVDSGDSMQGSLLSNIQQGYPTMAVFKALGYAATAVGNHDYDWGQTVLGARQAQAAFPFLSANIRDR